MEIRAFAEQVLHGESLADKLLDPGRLSDDIQGIPSPIHLPGRPIGLRLGDRAPKERVALPGPEALHEPRRRGLLLHSFANHELLALELMALCLLRFPEAPSAFRRGLAQTLREEQRHLRLYLDRMAVMGVSFGEVPVNDFFWRCVADVPSPMDFVLRMSLVFEQANLDFATHYARIFTRIGDTETAAVLQQVHDDEVGHVRLGLHWFRQWRPPGDEWSFFVDHLVEPLGPSRAKGPIFERQLRLDIGFSEDFVDHLELWGRSRGRPPVVWTFNPLCEEEVARGAPGLSPPQHLQALQADLAGVLLWLTAKDDVALLPIPPTDDYLKQLRELGRPLPEIISNINALKGRKIGGLSPWGWSPDSAARLASLGAQWQPERAAAYGKDLGLKLRLKFLEEHKEEDWLSPAWGHYCQDASAIDAARQAISGEVIIKARFKSSGRDMIRLLPDQALTPQQAGWLRKVLQQGGVVVEPWCQRIMDLSFHFDLKEQMSFIGVCRFLTQPSGQFAGALLGRWQDDLPPELRRFLHGGGKDPRRLSRIAALIGRHLSEPLRALGVQGPVGVDAFVYQSPEGLKLQPLLEINPRWTMGRVAMELGNLVHPTVQGIWRIYSGAQLQEIKNSPPSPIQWRDGRIVQGRVFSNDPATAQQALGVLDIGTIGSTAG